MCLSGSSNDNCAMANDKSNYFSFLVNTDKDFHMNTLYLGKSVYIIKAKDRMTGMITLYGKCNTDFSSKKSI